MQTTFRTEEEIAADPRPGDIYVTSWGYDQTNSEFYQVVKRTPGTVHIRRIAAHVEGGRLYPEPGRFITTWQEERKGWVDGVKVCRLSTKLTKWQQQAIARGSTEAPSMGKSLTLDYVRNAYPYDGGGAYDTYAAGGAGH